MGGETRIGARTGRWLIPAALLLLATLAGCSSAEPVEVAALATPADSAAVGATGGEIVPVAPTAAVTTGVATADANPAPTSTLLPPPTAAPTATPTSIPTPTPTPTPALRQLTTGGCCTQPFWSPDSRWVIFVDKPAPDAPVGYWGVDTAAPGSAPQLLTERIAFYTSDLTHLVEYGDRETIIERLAGPLSDQVLDRWTAPADGRSISISPGLTRIAWSEGNTDAPSELRVSEVWVADFDGTGARPVATLPRGGLSGWITDDRLLLSGRESLQSQETVLYAHSLIDDSLVELARSERPRGFQLSPDGRWLAYYVTLSDQAAENGLWLLRTDTGVRRPLGRELFGSYAWRDARRLLIIPFQLDAQYHAFWEVDAETGEARLLVDPAVMSIKVANADWRVSPDGRQVVFVESGDRNLWLLTLGD